MYKRQLWWLPDKDTMWLPDKDTVWLPHRDTVWLLDKDTVCLPHKDAVWLPDKVDFSEFGKWSFFQLLGLRSKDIGVRWKMVSSPAEISI